MSQVALFEWPEAEQLRFWGAEDLPSAGQPWPRFAVDWFLARSRHRLAAEEARAEERRQRHLRRLREQWGGHLARPQPLAIPA